MASKSTGKYLPNVRYQNQHSSARRMKGEKMITASWKVSGLFKADPQKVAEEIKMIGEEITPDQIVEAAKDKSTELHKCFDWDDEVAAAKWRKQQARQIMCYLVIKEEEQTEEPPVRVFYKNDNGGYKQTEMIFRVDDEYQKLLKAACAELAAFKRKYARLQELSEILALID